MAEEVRPDPDRDPVEHDRRDHLVGADRRLEEAGDPGPDRAGERRRADRRAGRAAASTCRRTTCRSRSRRTSPTKYWPWPPMLNIPQRNANATARPVRIERRRLEQRLREVVGGGVGRRVGRRMEEPVQAGAVEDVAVGEQRVVAGRARRPTPPIRNATSAVRTGTTMPPARWPSHDPRRRACSARSAGGCGGGAGGRRSASTLTPRPSGARRASRGRSPARSRPACARRRSRPRR